MPNIQPECWVGSYIFHGIPTLNIALADNAVYCAIFRCLNTDSIESFVLPLNIPKTMPTQLSALHPMPPLIKTGTPIACCNRGIAISLKFSTTSQGQFRSTA
jgi:hypothetical protein